MINENLGKDAILESIHYHIEILESFREQPWHMKKKLRAARQAREFLRWQIRKVGGIKQLNSNQRMVRDHLTFLCKGPSQHSLVRDRLIILHPFPHRQNI